MSNDQRAPHRRSLGIGHWSFSPGPCLTFAAQSATSPSIPKARRPCHSAVHAASRSIWDDGWASDMECPSSAPTTRMSRKTGPRIDAPICTKWRRRAAISSHATPKRARSAPIVVLHIVESRKHCYCVVFGAIYNCQRSLYFPA